MDYHKGVLRDVTDEAGPLRAGRRAAGRQAEQGLRPGLLPRARRERAARGRLLPCWMPAARAGRSALGRVLRPAGSGPRPAAGPSAATAEQVAAVDLSRGKIVYLSDLKPDSAVVHAALRHGEGAARPAGVLPPAAGPEHGIQAAADRRQDVTPRGCACTAAPRWSIACRAGSAASRRWRESTTTSGPAATSAW